MAIKKYYAIADNTITNAFKDSRFTDTTRATGSNMGLADSLEIFSIYGQGSSSAGFSQELSRILVKFPVTTTDDASNSIQAHRTAGLIPAKDSVKFFLRLYNVEHDKPVPRSAKYNIFAVSSSWEEGRGLDMDEYKDITRGNVGSNWISANGNTAKASLVDAIDITGHANGDKFTMTVPTSAGGDGVTYTFLLDSTTNVNNDTGANTFGISRQIPSDDAATTVAIINAINGVANAAVKYGDADTGAGTTLTAGTIGLTAAVGGSTSKITLTMDDAGVKGNVAGVLAAVTGFENDLLLEATFTGGDGPWTTVGGDYHSAEDATNNTIMYNTTLEEGTEDIEVDVTALVEEWIDGTHPDGYTTMSNYGFGIHLTSSQEAFFNSSTGQNYTAANGGIIHNTAGATTSYFTKKFSARGSEFFFQRPTLEARWDSAKKDDRGNFYYSSSLATADDNINTLYYYNYYRGQLRDIPGTDGNPGKGNLIYVTLFSDSGDGKTPDPNGTIELSVDGTYVSDSTRNTVVTGGWVETGIYTASFAVTGATEAGEELTKLYDVWYITSSVGEDFTSGIQVNTGSIIPEKLSGYDMAPEARRINSITNLKDIYSFDEKARFRVYSRHKNWNPTIYTRATAQAENDIIESGSYRIYRVIDDQSAISYGTASATLHTQMSFDVSGNYFDLEMNMLEPGFAYAIKLAYYNGSVGAWVEQPEIFKFRVEKWE